VFSQVRRKIDKDQLIPDAKIVPLGVTEVSRLQAQHGHVYSSRSAA
jgi:intracellular sulfur oxidation DsrE/DsrF family protein